MGEVEGKGESPTDLQPKSEISVSLARAIWQTSGDSNMVGRARRGETIGGTLRGCLRTASSLRFLPLSYLPAKAITLDCLLDVLHHHNAHDNV